MPKEVRMKGPPHQKRDLAKSLKPEHAMANIPMIDSAYKIMREGHGRLFS